MSPAAAQHDPMALAIHHAVRAGACRAAALIQPECAGVWVQVADAESRRSRVALAEATRSKKP